MGYKRVRTKKIYEIVAEQLIEMIKSGELKPGDKLDSVEQLAKNFNVGRSAIREALSALRAMGLVHMKQGEGTFVNAYDFSKLSLPATPAILLDNKSMLEFFEVRKIIETGAASLAATKRKESDLAQMKAALDEMSRAAGDEDLGEKADVKFHLAIAEASQNSVLVKLMNQIADTMVETMRESRRIWLYAEESTFERLYQEHVSIYQAIVDRNAPLAEQLMLAHLVKVEEVLIRFNKDLEHTKTE
ncbi:GntR family transcriptional repressor for pyruvate dehydrogenase complex [Caldalkalibacillus uzonensis]|uniref:GntR family transcriptional repressor for pyruvate dehydrogenase complex n=1 Tax=Caldalkalibacillus uzonensis TaxID=353224 RepID=A0ABU0CUF3_9BACI|nr:FadR/GntR family transcriptional regulator [Caldalkalibacillus uzonensis]MDQ0340046.1 GntR family transcriptional repressor for pyruvate dehydrogenase complex [Caldalkalibacillus uzonensis]